MNAHASARPLFLTLLGICLAVPGQGLAARGYVARGCGFDLNFNGIVGEAQGDCDRVCRGGATGADVDGNGVADRQVYVDCGAGSNSATCGAPGSPCRTLQWALDGSDTSFADRIRVPGTNQIQAVCFRGTCAENINTTQSGAAGSVTRAAAGSEVRPFQFPRYPFILSGWDDDADGSYPPFDTTGNSPAVMDGNASGNLSFAISNTPPRSRLEFAHFGIRDYGLSCPNDSGAIDLGAWGGGDVNHFYVHDLDLANISTGCPSANTASGRIVFPLWNSGNVISYAAFLNLRLTGYGSWIARGSGADQRITGPYRFQNISAVARGGSGDTCFAFKLWDLAEGIEILDNVIDADPDGWNPDPYTSMGVIIAAQCTRDWVVRNNQFIDWKSVFAVQPSSYGACDTRPMDDLWFDRNIIRNTYAPYQYGDIPVHIQQGDVNGTAVTSDANSNGWAVRITNNFISSTPGYEACIWSHSGGPGGATMRGSIDIVGNTCVGDANRHAGIVIGNIEGSEPGAAFPNYRVQDNIIAGLSAGETNIWREAGYGTTITLDGNVYDPDADYVWNGSDVTTLTSWKTTSGDGAASRECVPSFVNAATGDYHLTATDACARNLGISLSAIMSVDIDGDPRGQAGAWDIGADEVGTGVTAPSPPTLLDVTPLPN